MFPYRYCLYTLLILLFSCKPEKKPPVVHSFYYWKSGFRLSDEESSKLAQLKTSHLYLHYFDVDWSETLKMAVPKAIIRNNIYEDRYRSTITYTPVIFITNRTFEQLTIAGSGELVHKITAKITAITTRIKAQLPTYAVQEIQIDCDWTAGTRQQYFHFLEAFKKVNPGITVSATIRLYPYKYPEKMGVPPVDKGMLMCYNLGKITNLSTQNSIFDLQELQQYLSDKAYPLPLDLAFPIFGWYTWFRDQQFKRIVYQDETFISDTTIFTREQEHRYHFLRDTVIDDLYFREGDLLRMEYPDPQALTAAVALMTNKIPGYQRIAFYYWNLPSITTYESVIRETFDRY